MNTWELPSQELPNAYWQGPERQIAVPEFFFFSSPHGGLESEMRCDFEI
jgi:hypothetical protein